MAVSGRVCVGVGATVQPPSTAFRITLGARLAQRQEFWGLTNSSHAPPHPHCHDPSMHHLSTAAPGETGAQLSETHGGAAQCKPSALLAPVPSPGRCCLADLCRLFPLCSPGRGWPGSSIYTKRAANPVTPSRSSHSVLAGSPAFRVTVYVTFKGPGGHAAA